MGLRIVRRLCSRRITRLGGADWVSMGCRTYQSISSSTLFKQGLESTKFRFERLINTLSHSVADDYEKMLRRIDKEHVQEARCLLHLVVAGIKPLILSEMDIALAHEQEFGIR